MAFDGTLDKEFSRTAMGSEFLDAETEKALATAWRKQGDEAALHRLITAYLRMAISMASKFRKYGAPMNDLAQEASLGLMRAAERFDPDRGVRFSTYAVWWIKASIQDYVMRNWSMVRTGSTTPQKSLFFNLRRVQSNIERAAAADGETLSAVELRKRVSAELGVTEQDVEMMEGRLLRGDFSLNAPQLKGEEGRDWLDALEDENPIGSETARENLDTDTIRRWLVAAMQGLNAREQLIIRKRKLIGTPKTLDSLGKELALSKERVRQIEKAALEKMRKTLSKHAPEILTLLH